VAREAQGSSAGRGSGAELAGPAPAGQGGAPRPPRRYGFFRPRPHRAWHRWCRRLLEGLLGVVAGLVILLGFAAWRLSEGPVPLNFLTPRLVKAFGEGGTQVAIGQTLLVWDDRRQSLDLRVRDLTILDDDGGPALTLPESNLALSTRALLRGDLVVSSLTVLGADLRLTRLQDGSFLGLGNEGGSVEPRDGPAAETGPALGLIDTLLADEEGGALEGLEGIGLIDSTVVFDDRLTGQVWTLPARRIDLRREARGLSGEAELAVELAGETAYLDVVFAYGKRRGLLDLSANVRQLATAKLAAALPELAALALLDTRVDGQVNLTLARDADLGLVDFALDFGPGRLWLGGAGEPAIALAGGSLAGLYDLSAGTLELDRLRLQTGSAAAPGPLLHLQGRVAEDARGRVADVTVTLDQVAAAALGDYWPAGRAAGGRAWVLENISGGWVRNLRVGLGLRITEGAERPEVTLERLEGGFDVEDFTIAYLAPIPPATGVDARATVGLGGLDFQITEAHAGALAFNPIALSIYGLDGDDHRLRLSAQGEGPLPALFAVLDHPRLALLSTLGLPTAGAAGRVALALDFDFSLLGDVTFDKIAMSGEATIEDLVLPGLLAGQDLAARRLALAVDNRQLTARGEVSLGGGSFAAEWTEPLAGGERRLAARSDSVPASTLVALVPALEGRIDGSLGLSLDLRGQPQGRGSVAVEADLGAAALALPDLELTKAAGEPSSARFLVRLEQGRVVALENLAFAAPGFVVEGALALGDGGRLAGVSLTRAEAFGQSLRGVEGTPLPDGGWRLALTGGTLDARPWLEGIEGAAAEEQPATPLQVEAQALDRVILTNGSLENVTLSATRDAIGIARLALAGDLIAAGAPGGRVTLALEPDASGRRALLLQASDMGSLFRALDIVDTVIGGTLTIEARAETAERGSRMNGTVEGRAYRLIKAPTLAKILMSATLIGIGDALDSEGIPFERLTGEIAFHDGVLSTPLLRAYGGSLGITAEGSLDFGRDVIDIEGTVVPAYAINDVIGDIPIIGWIITGGDGGGLLAVSYAVSGAVSDPQVSVNPLSALTPGFLRGLFDLFEDDGTAPPPTLYPEGPGR
jgi:hypothetical protein